VTQEGRATWEARVAALSQEQRRWLAQELTTRVAPRRLVAYVVGTEPAVDPSTFARFSAEHLPGVMVPATFTVVTALPRTASGKLDRAALGTLIPIASSGAPTASSDSVATPLVPARNDIEQALAEIWQDVLDLDEVSVHDDFFEVGGDSLLSIRVLARAGREGFKISPEAFFERPTIAHLAQCVRSEPASPDEATPGEQGEVSGPAPLTPIQHWFFDRIGGTDWWNQCQAVVLDPPLEPKRVGEIMDALLRHHDALRMRLATGPKGLPQQDFVTATGGDPLRVVAVGALSGPELDARIAAELDGVQRDIRIGEGPLLRALLVQRSGGSDRLILVVHHLVVDGVSWAILLEDLSALVGQARSGVPFRLPTKTVSAKAWAERLEQFAGDGAVRESVAHWRAQPAGDALRVPVKEPPTPGDNRVIDSAVHTVRLDSTSSERLLHEQPGALDATVQELLLAGLAMAWEAWTARPTLLLDIEGHGRDLVGGMDVSRSVGWFTTVFPFWIDLGFGRPTDAVSAVRAALRKAPPGGTHGVLRYSESANQGTRQALEAAQSAEVLFNYLGNTATLLPRDSTLRLVDVPGVVLRDPQAPRAYVLEINVRIEDRALVFSIEYSGAVHQAKEISGLGDELNGALTALASVAPAAAEGAVPRAGHPRTDFADIPAAELDKIGSLLSEFDDE